MKISDLETVQQLVEKRQGIMSVTAMIDAGEPIELKIGSVEVPIERPEIIQAARYQLKVHFEAELKDVNEALKQLDVVVSDV